MDQIRDLENMIENVRKNFSLVTKLDDKIAELTKQVNTIENKIVEFVNHTELEIYVTWPALESCLKGIKDMLDQSLNKQLDIKQTQTSRPSSMNQPSKELQELLLKLGTLNDRHESLRELVELLKAELDKQAGNGKVPEDIMQRLEELKRIKAALEELKNNFAIVSLI
jgi:chromosome segregation ATPase